ncbi:hypothetical protein AQ914_04610 [Burkholderia pseudomallei]|uniref:glycosyltransferase family 9 protein n=1 Tax=Burkholderia pseudomallei TaxID=28450 RepID=UPI0009755EBB|nr:glycosyltransferase family 9 protein [Burkholderia pseudomallei]ONC26367.1 hypothetical protein AQ914_04610 [Burkholderia pseudomallei]
MTNHESQLEHSLGAYLTTPSPASALQLMRTLRASGRASDAIDLARRWLPAYPHEYRCHLAIELNSLGLFEEARKALQEGLPFLRGETDRYLASLELAISLYSLGRFHEAHPILRWLRGAEQTDVWLRMTAPQWSEEKRRTVIGKLLDMETPVAGRRILILSEGGAGDTMMFYRYIPELVREGAACVHVQAPESLRCLFSAQSFGKPVSRPSLDDYDLIAWTFNLYARYQQSPYTNRCPGAYLKLPEGHALPPAVYAALGAHCDRRRVGLIWRSDSKVRHEPYRSMELHRLEPLLRASDTAFFSLQTGTLTPSEREILQHHNVADLGAHLRSFSDTAHILSDLDLLISIDTGPIHLAGALDRPVWAMLSRACDQRWYDCQHFTPWYRSMRLYRQAILGDWGPVVDSVSSATNRAYERTLCEPVHLADA